MTAAVVVTAILGLGVVTGLNVKSVGHAIERLSTFNISLPKPPPPPPPPPKPRPQAQKKPEAAPAAPKASPVVAPKPVVQLPTTQPVAAARQPGTGASSSNGQGGVGNGTGAGGTGNGLGGGGGGGGGNTPARLIRNLTRGDYRAVTAGRMPAGSAGLAIGIDTAGRVSSCQVEHSSGDPGIDARLCPLVRSRLLFDPARNARGQPIPFYSHFMATWRP